MIQSWSVSGMNELEAEGACRSNWVVSNTVGFTVGGAIAGSIARSMGQSRYGVEASTAGAVLIAVRTAGAALAVWGAAVGIAQWLVIRGWLKRVGWWAPATSAGWALAGVVAGILSGVMGGAVLASAGMSEHGDSWWRPWWASWPWVSCRSRSNG
jgi:hypothetical protein